MYRSRTVAGALWGHCRLTCRSHRGYVRLQLCPPSVPSDWRAACLGAELFFEPPTGPQQALSLMPEVSNGHVGWKLQSNTVYAAGLFNGPAGSPAEGDGDGRARIQPFGVQLDPAWSSPKLDPVTSLGQALDVRRAVFLARSTTSDGVAIEERWYAPLHAPRLLVHVSNLQPPPSCCRNAFSSCQFLHCSEDAAGDFS